MAALNTDGRRLGEDHWSLDALAEISTPLTANGDRADSGLLTTFVPAQSLLFAGALAYYAARGTSSPACARPTIPAIPTAATTPSPPWVRFAWP
jgi:hypothetical protein